MRIRKKDLDKHFFKSRGQMYMIYPECLTPVEVYHNGVWVESESIIVFPENGTMPYNCRHPALYDMDSLLSKVHEVQLIAKNKRGFSFGNINPNKIWDWIPLFPMISAYSAARSVTVSLLRSTCQPLDQHLSANISATLNRLISARLAA